MRGIERKLSIIKDIQEQGQADINELAAKYEVSTMTIRRDLSKLSEEGLVTLEYGGAVLNSGAVVEYNMYMKEAEFLEEKQRIAQECASYIKEGDSIFLDAGTTVCEVAKCIANRKNITVMTHSLLVANILSGSDLNVIMCPGQFRKKSMAYIGQFTDDFIDMFQIDKLFLGIEGIDLECGLSVPNVEDGITKRHLIKQAKWVACLADHSKFNQMYYYKICDLGEIDLLVTDNGLQSEMELPVQNKFNYEIKIT